MLQIYTKCLQSKNIVNTFYKRYTHTNYYEVLHLSRKCSAKDIRNSFVYLTKKYHPDRTDNKALHAQFVKIVEAYNILCKPESRQAYDRALAQANLAYCSTPLRPNPNVKYTYYQYQMRRDPWADPLFWHNRKQKMETSTDYPYYGIQGFDKISNSFIVLLCCILAGLGFTLQMLAIRNSVTLRRANMIKIANDAEDNLRKIREQAEVNGNEMQIQIIEEKFRLEEERWKKN